MSSGFSFSNTIENKFIWQETCQTITIENCLGWIRQSEPYFNKNPSLNKNHILNFINLSSNHLIFIKKKKGVIYGQELMLHCSWICISWTSEAFMHFSFMQQQIIISHKQAVCIFFLQECTDENYEKVFKENWDISKHGGADVCWSNDPKQPVLGKMSMILDEKSVYKRYPALLTGDPFLTAFPFLVVNKLLY